MLASYHDHNRIRCTHVIENALTGNARILIFGSFLGADVFILLFFFQSEIKVLGICDILEINNHESVNVVPTLKHAITIFIQQTFKEFRTSETNSFSGTKLLKSTISLK